MAKCGLKCAVFDWILGNFDCLLKLRGREGVKWSAAIFFLVVGIFVVVEASMRG